MTNIDCIFALLDWNNDIELQEKGIRMSAEIKCINVFLQPGSPYGKRVWANCAKILSNKSDEELKPYLLDLFDWLQDLNWPGADIIYNRLNKYEDTQSFETSLDISVRHAIMLKDSIWEDTLRKLKEDRETVLYLLRF